MDTTASCARIIGGNTEEGIVLAAAAARISTTKGTALALFEASRHKENNLSLVQKVLSSGHKSLIEHCVFHLAFNNVSVFAEQFVIEFRLASFTVKSRRYVDFSGAGFLTDDALPEPFRARYAAHMSSLFETYGRLTDLGIPREDARFVLPYCFCSNFYCTCNARELVHMICSMLYGRGSDSPELVRLGRQLQAQLEQYLPGVVEEERAAYAAAAPGDGDEARHSVAPLREVAPAVELLSHPRDAGAMVALAGQFSRTLPPPASGAAPHPERDRAYECLNYVFRLRDLSLSSITHLVRHRMQSVLVPHVGNAVLRNRHILPETVRRCPEALRLYRDAFGAHSALAEAFLEERLPLSQLAYLALSGHTLDVLTNINGRELFYFLGLRTCSRAQWEIRGVAVEMLRALKRASPGVFDQAGPGCYRDGLCPEGEKCCGEAERVRAFFRTLPAAD